VHFSTTNKALIDTNGDRLLEERGGDPSKMKDVMEALQSKARDNARTPVQVSDEL